MRRRLLVIHNPAAGRGVRRLALVLDALAREGVDVELAPTSHPGHAAELARRARNCDAVVAAGGDGTISEIANGIGALPLGIIPLGTANVLAIELGYPREAAAVARVLVRGGLRKVRAGRVGNRRFVQMVSAGFDARVVARLDLALKRRVGKVAYVVAGAVQMLAGERPPINLQIDGTRYAAGQVIVANGRHYGGGFVIAPLADLSAAEFQVCLFPRGDAIAIAGYVLSIALGRLQFRSDVRIFPAREIRLDTPPGDPMQVDGDPLAGLPAVVDIDPTPLWLIAP